VAIGAEQLPDRQLYRRWLVIGIKRRVQRGANLRMFNPCGESRGEGVGIRDASGGLAASVKVLTPLEAVDPGGAFGWVELGGVFEVGGPAPVHLLGDPAFVADVGVAATLVERGEEALHLGPAVPGRREPWPLAAAGIRVGHRVTRVGQAGPAGLEAADRFERLI
jgi:hypothetical protein